VFVKDIETRLIIHTDKMNNDTNTNKNEEIFNIEENKYIEEPWTIIESYFKDQHLDRLVRHQLESYNNFVGYQIIKTIEMFNPVHIKSENDYDEATGKYSLEMFITFSNFHIYRPQIHENNGAIKLMFPQEARLRNFTYASAMTVDINIKYVIRDGETLDNVTILHKTLPKIHIGKLPIMLKSNICVLNQYKYVDHHQTGECKYDAGGYFIINGSEKTVLGQERTAENRVYCFNVAKNDTKYSWKAEIKSIPDFKCISPKQINMMISSKNNGFGYPITIQIPRVKQPVPLFVVFRALNVLTDKDICEHILLDIDLDKYNQMLSYLQASIIDANKYMTYEDAVKYITNHVSYTPLNMDKDTGALKKHQFALEVLQNDLFPHCQTLKQKIYFLGYMANKLLQASLEWIKMDDRDSYINKRIDLTGTSLNNLFRNYFNKLVKDMEKQVIKEIKTGSWRSKEDYLNIINLTNIYKIIKSTTIENGIKRALSTGDFGIKHTNSNKVGVAQVLNRLTYIASLSHLRRISTPTDKSGKLVPPRKLHNTSWGYLCVAECFDPETEILMWDGTYKLAKNILIGDVLIDDLGNSTTVRTTCSGFKNMYDIIPDKSNFMKHRVTDNHILTLKIRGHKSISKKSRNSSSNSSSKYAVKYLERNEIKFHHKHFVSLEEAKDFVQTFQDDDTIDITIENYLKLDDSVKNNLVLFKTNGIKEMQLDPYSNFKLVEVGIGPYVGWQLHDKRGRFCLRDGLVVHNTPEGASVGIVKNLSYMAHITIHSESNSLYDYIIPKIISIEETDLTPKSMHDKVKIFINGSWVGITHTPVELYNQLKEMKCKGIINIYTSIIFDYRLQEIRICNDSGRVTRPLLRVKNKNILLTNQILNDLKENNLVWDDLLTDCKINDAVIEYIDPEEQSFSMIATKPKNIIEQINTRYTHCEIHPSTIFGVVASCIPYPDHNQSPRNTYQCLDINETVLLSNGSTTCIKNIKVGDEVVCFNPETMDISYTKVINQYVRETNKQLYKIKTITGREVIATEDHKFMTIEGWKEVKDFVENDTMIGIMPTQSSIIDKITDNYVIINENMFRDYFIELGIDLKYINVQINKLKDINLLPLNSNDYRLPIIARIFGFLMADGSINIYEKNTKYISCSFSFGTENDVKQFEDDVEQCGINKCKYNYSSRMFNDVTHSTYNVTHNGSLPSLLIGLGISYGKKTEHKRKPVPEWIMNGSKLIKREFLGGFQGGDGCKIRWNKTTKGYNFICAETSQQINPDYTDSLSYFMNQCVILLNEFEIECRLQDVVNICHNRNKIAYKILDKQKNLIKYYDLIGYRYAFTKNISSFVVIEYLRYKEIEFKKHVQFIKNIRQLCDKGKTNSLISYETGIPVNQVSDIRRSYNNKREICMHKLGNNTIEQWINNIQIINGMIFINISDIIPIENRLVSDITVESENHSFITTGGILSSNCAQAKQAMGVYATNYNERMDKTAYVLTYATRPLVDTRIMNLMKLNENPSGCNINVAIMTHTGYNQEDSLLVNKGSIDRGLLQITITHTEKDEDKQKINGDEEIRCKPEPSKTKGMKFGNYNKVNSKGIVPENTLIENRDIIIAKVTPIKENRNDHTKVIKYEDGSKQYKTVEETYIDKNYIDRNGDGYSFAKVRLRTLRKPVIGDKFSSRHGQKGTVGNIIPEEDMPFTSSGVRPDIIINPHAIPSRMTIGQLKETLLGKVLVELGLFGDGTSFGELDVDTISKKLLELGYEAHGNELMYNGLTGEQIECNVFMGPVFYQRLKHMVNDKAHSRSIGPMVNLTRQPAEGRSRDGGLRFGEMERDCTISHGASRFTRGRMYDASDKYSVFVCKKCGLIASYNDELHIHCCRTCDNRVEFNYVEIPYACKLLFQELITMNVVPRLITEK
jgi:DNA-directed RNA polymerase beta subunit